MLLLEGHFSAVFEGSDLAPLLSAGTGESLHVSFVHLVVIEISLLTASVLPMNPFHSTEPQQLFLLALLLIQPECC